MAASEIWTWGNCEQAVKILRGRLGFPESHVVTVMGLSLDTDTGKITDTLSGRALNDRVRRDRSTANTLFYLLSAYSRVQPVPPRDHLITSKQFKGAQFSRRDNIGERSRLVKCFGDNPDTLLEAARLLGGSRVDFPYGLAVRVHPLPLVPVTVVVSPADEEFQAEANIFYRGDIGFYLDSEQAYFLTSLCVSRLITAASLPTGPG